MDTSWNGSDRIRAMHRFSTLSATVLLRNQLLPILAAHNAVDACKLVLLEHLERLGKNALCHPIADSAFANEELYIFYNELLRDFTYSL